MPVKPVIRLLGVARNPANGFPARPLANRVASTRNLSGSLEATTHCAGVWDYNGTTSWTKRPVGSGFQVDTVTAVGVGGQPAFRSVVHLPITALRTAEFRPVAHSLTLSGVSYQNLGRAVRSAARLWACASSSGVFSRTLLEAPALIGVNGWRGQRLGAGTGRVPCSGGRRGYRLAQCRTARAHKTK